MITVIAIDALEYELAEQFDLSHLKQTYYGKTDISEFSEPRTIVLWSSFMTGKNMESEILAGGEKEMWNIRIDHSDSFFSRFKEPCIIDLPGYNYDLEQHTRERGLLSAYFDADEEEKEKIKKKYNEHAFEHHRRIRSEFMKALKGGHDFICCYFSIADVIGHLNFGNRALMRVIYRELSEIASGVDGELIILSDHGMKAIGGFGDHSEYGFWSSGSKDLGTPKITDFARIITSMAMD
ncbi:MAG: hypothetical protein JSW28_02720 [Thermoplasmata archaeon]|nr:MAG: hypothetical protein JSW28_02720 [Thermoplasmata archaeon]